MYYTNFYLNIVTTNYNNNYGGKFRELRELVRKELKELVFLPFQSKMAKFVQRKLSISSKYDEDFIKFRNAIIKLEGAYHGHFQEYLIEAVRYYTEKLTKAPEELGKVRNKKKGVTAVDKEITSFYSKFENTLTLIEDKGLKEKTLLKLLEVHFEAKSEKTIRDKRNRLLRFKNWAIIKIPNVRPRIILSRDNPLYEVVYRFDLDNEQNGLRANLEEQRVLNYLKKTILEI